MPDSGDAAVGGHDDDGREVGLERAIEEREALHVQHVHLVDEQHARHDLCLACTAHVSNTNAAKGQNN